MSGYLVSIILGLEEVLINDKLRRWTKKENYPDFYELSELCKITNMSSDYFIFGAEKNSPKEFFQELIVIEEIGLEKYKEVYGNKNIKKLRAEITSVFNELIDTNFLGTMQIFDSVMADRLDDEYKLIFLKKTNSFKEQYFEKDDFYEVIEEKWSDDKEKSSFDYYFQNILENSEKNLELVMVDDEMDEQEYDALIEKAYREEFKMFLDEKLLGKRLTTIRKMKGENQKNFAKIAGLTNSISSYETGVRKLKFKEIKSFLKKENISKQFMERGGIQNVSTS